MHLAAPISLALLAAAPAPRAPQVEPQAVGTPATGPWHAWLDCPGGALPFGLELDRTADGGWAATLRNGPEEIEVPAVRLERIEDRDGRLTFSFPHYDATIEADVAGGGTLLAGMYEKRTGADTWRRMPFHARAGREPRFPSENPPASERASVAGRWRIAFASEDTPAVGELAQAPDGSVTGTILTATGDYRYLAGSVDGDVLRLSVFDGAHAFLLVARVDSGGALAGDFWSGDAWHDTWTAGRDDHAALADPFAATRWQAGASLADLVLPDLDGNPRSLADPELRGTATLVVLFGSWCPNCNDEADTLRALLARHASRGLRVLGLAFELTGEHERDARQVRRFLARHRVDYPVLLAGTADKAAASLAFPELDRVRAFPTTLFVDAAGRVRWVHSGFAGPATGDDHTALVAEFEQRIEDLLAHAEPSSDALVRALTATAWRVGPDASAATVALARGPDGALVARLVSAAPDAGTPDGTLDRALDGEAAWPEGAAAGDEHAARVVGADAIWIGARVLRLDPAAGALLSPTAFGARWMPVGAEDSPLLVARGYAGPASWTRALADPDPLVRREAVWALGRRLADTDPGAAAPFLPLRDDPDVAVVAAATWALGRTADPRAAAALLALRDHPSASVRREVARALVRLARTRPQLGATVRALAADADPVVRAIASAGDAR